MVPQEVALFLTLEVVLFLTLERLKRGTKTNSPAYIYIYAVGSITWPHFGHFKVNNLATSRSITWPPFFEPIKIGFLRLFCAQFSGGGAKLVFLKMFWSKKGFPKKKQLCTFLGGGLGFTSLLLHDVTRCFRRSVSKTL